MVDLPPDAPTGKVEVTIEPQAVPEAPTAAELTPREIARAKLLAADRLATNIKAPEDTRDLSAEEVLELGTLPPGSPLASEMIIQDRGEY